MKGGVESVLRKTFGEKQEVEQVPSETFVRCVAVATAVTAAVVASVVASVRNHGSLVSIAEEGVRVSLLSSVSARLCSARLGVALQSCSDCWCCSGFAVRLLLMQRCC